MAANKRLPKWQPVRHADATVNVRFR
jgi:hypothetical protein